MSILWNQLSLKSSEILLDNIKNYNLVDQTSEYYDQASSWLNTQQYQLIANYPSIYNWILSYTILGQIMLIIGMLWLFDNLFIKPCFNKARWFALHVVGNACVIYYTWSDFKHLMSNPISAFGRIPHYEALNITVAIHFYHALFFKNLVAIDWVHHILMISIAIESYFCPSAIIIVTNGLLFFLNGLPGCLDYLLLILVKYDLIRPIREKELNSYLNIWIRSPGVIIGTYNMYLTTVYTKYDPNQFTSTLIIIILIWNAQYFTYRVIGNYFARLTEKCIQFEKREGRRMSTTDETKCKYDEDSLITELDVIEELSDAEDVPFERLIEDIIDDT